MHCSEAAGLISSAPPSVPRPWTQHCVLWHRATQILLHFTALTVDILSRTKCSAFCSVQLPLAIKVCGFAKWKPASVQCQCTACFSTLPAAQKTSRLSRLRGWLESTVTTRVVRMRIVSTFTIQDLEIPQTWCFWFEEFLFHLFLFPSNSFLLPSSVKARMSPALKLGCLWKAEQG